MKTSAPPPGQANEDYLKMTKQASEGFTKFLGPGKTTIFVMPPDPDNNGRWHRPTYQHKFYITTPTGERKFTSYNCPGAVEMGPCPVCDLIKEFQEMGDQGHTDIGHTLFRAVLWLVAAGRSAPSEFNGDILGQRALAVAVAL